MEAKKSCCQGQNGERGGKGGCGCGVAPKITVETASAVVPPYISGWKETVAGLTPVARTDWDAADRRGAWRVRWSGFRNRYRVAPGLYAVGDPTPVAPVLVTGNYKLSFDMLRRELGGTDAWILVLDTRGINVWCAAGKGAFGTEELTGRIRRVELERVVSGRQVILPQLGAPGVSAHRVLKETGFRVIYGPVYAADLPRFLREGQVKAREMRSVRFDFRDRLRLLPMELLPGFRLGVFFLIPWLILAGIGGGWRPEALGNGALYWLCALLAGAGATPLLSPWIPGASFFWKGWIMGVLAQAGGLLLAPGTFPESLAAMLIFPPFSAYLALNFTGSTPYTSLSGVVREMRLGFPPLILSLAAGVILKIYTLI